MNTIVDLLQYQAAQNPQKLAFLDLKTSLTFSQALHRTRQIATALLPLATKNAPVAIYLDKSPQALCAMLSAPFSGNFYVVIDTNMPVERIATIFDTLNPVCVITDQALLPKAQQFCSCQVITVESTLDLAPDDAALDLCAKHIIDTDPLYALFTSGSTGVPKGVVISHKNVLAYSQWAVDTFHFDTDTVFGNQTPFYFSMSVTDIYSTLRCGATLLLLPKMLFSFPAKLLATLNEYKVNTIYWVPSALGIICNLKGLDYVPLNDLHTVLFAGEVMPTKYLNYWKSHLPNATYANLYGPTETTDICAYYIVNREFTDDEPLPIGVACKGCDVLVIAEDGQLAAPGQEGELCARGSFLAMGYYKNPQKTAEAFVQNPLNPYYPEVIYKTGDLVTYNQYGELMYLTRKDFQIKHMGYRIELGEIEISAYGAPGLESAACVYLAKKEQIVLFYQGKNLSEGDLCAILAKKLPAYMMPARAIHMNGLPHNQNGKVDRKALMALLDKEEEK